MLAGRCKVPVTGLTPHARDRGRIGMNTTVTRAVAAALLLSSGRCLAVGLGPATVSSDLSSPLAVAIPLRGLAAAGVDPGSLVVEVPGHAEHARLGMPDPVLPRELSLVLEPDRGGDARIRLSTRLATREPVLRFLLRARWPGGSVVREYTLLIDPPLVVRPRPHGTAVVMTSPAAGPRAVPAVELQPHGAAGPAAARPGSAYGPVAPGETLYRIAASAYPARVADFPSLAAAIVAANPGAFVDGDPARLKAGATLTLPAIPGLPASEAAAQEPRPGSPPGPWRYQVQEGDTLYGIARRSGLAGEAGLAALVDRLFRVNPHAFVDGDADRLRTGATLELEGAPPPRVAAAPAQAGPGADAHSATPAPPTGATAADPDAAAVVLELEQIQAIVASEQEVRRGLLTRLAETERQIAGLQARDAELDATLATVEDRLQERVARGADPAAAQAAPAPGADAATSTGSSPAEAAPAAAAPRAATPRREIPGQSAPASAGPDPWWVDLAWPLVTVAALVLALAGLLLVRRRRAMHPGAAAGGAASGADREARERAARERLAALRETHGVAAADAARDETEPHRDVAAAPGNVHLTDTAKAADLAKEAAVHLAYGQLKAAQKAIEEAIRLDPHRDEHKMVLLTICESAGQQDRARAIVDELLSRREHLSGELRRQVDHQLRRLASTG